MATVTCRQNYLHVIIVVEPIYQEIFNTVMVGLLLYAAKNVESARPSTHNTTYQKLQSKF